MQTWSVGVLCYNEAETLKSVVTALRQVLTQLTSTYEIIIVDDCSTDGSREVAKNIAAEHDDVRVILHDVNRGIGGTLRTIYTGAKYENVAISPGDGQFDPTELLPFKDIPANSFVSFFRKENTSYSLSRNILSLFNKKLNKIFLGIKLHDVNWTKIYKKADLDQLDLELKSSLVESEICAKLLIMGKNVIEVESKYLPRTYGVSKGASFAIVKKAIKDTWTLILITRRFKKSRRN